MKRRAASAGAALVLVALAAAAAPDATVIQTPTCTHNNFRILEAVLPSILARSLRASGNSEGLAAAGYLDGHLGIAFRIAVAPSQRDAYAGRPSLGSKTMMSFSQAEQEIDINHSLLHLDGSDEELIIRDSARLEKTASRFWPAIVHEISHARTAQGRTRFLADVVIEDEYIAFERQLSFIVEQLQADPGYLDLAADAPCAREDVALLTRARALLAEKPSRASRARRLGKLAAEEKALKARCPRLEGEPDGDTALLLALYARSNAELEASIKKTYEKQERLSIDDPKLAARARAQAQGLLRTLTGFLARHPAPGESASDPFYATHAAIVETTKRIVDSKRKALAFWNDPEAVSAAVTEYKKLLASVRADADQKRERYALVLKPFATDPTKE